MYLLKKKCLFVQRMIMGNAAPILCKLTVHSNTSSTHSNTVTLQDIT